MIRVTFIRLTLRGREAGRDPLRRTVNGRGGAGESPETCGRYLNCAVSIPAPARGSARPPAGQGSPGGNDRGPRSRVEDAVRFSDELRRFPSLPGFVVAEGAAGPLLQVAVQ